MADTDYTKALTPFCQLIGLFDGDGSIQWGWFQNPLAGTIAGMAANREKLGDLFRALDSETDDKVQVFDEATSLEWQPHKLGGVSLGFVWNKDGQPSQPLHLSFGAAVPYPGPKSDPSKPATPPKTPPRLTLRAALAQFDGTPKQEKITPEFGDLAVSADLPVPDFLDSGKLTISRAGTKFTLSLSATNKTTQTRTLTIQFPPVAPAPDIMAWDGARLAAFVTHALVTAHAKPDDPKEFFHRIDKHFFPLCGDPAKPFDPLPPFDQTGQPPDFKAWRGSLTANLTNALTALWHLRALITGNEDANYLPGSAYFQVAPPPTPSKPSAFPNFNPVAGARTGAAGTTWVALIDNPPSTGSIPSAFDLKLVVRGKDGGDLAVPIAGFKDQTVKRPVPPDCFGAAGFADLKAKLKAVLPDVGSAGDEARVSFRDAKDDFEIVLARHDIAPTDETFPAMMRGPYSLGLLVSAKNGVSYNFSTPMLQEALPPPAGDSAKDFAVDAVRQLTDWGLRSALPDNNPFVDVVTTLTDFTADVVKNGAPKPAAAVAGIVGLTALLGKKGHFDVGPLTLLIGDDGTKPPVTAKAGTLQPGLEIGPIKPESLGGAMSIGKVSASATLDLNASSPVTDYSLALHDVRLGEGGGGNSGLSQMLIPDLREVNGFDLTVSKSGGVAGGGRVLVQRTVGPLEIVSLSADVSNASLKVSLDLFFKLGPLTVTAYNLGLTMAFQAGALPKPFLDGLGVTFDGGGVNLAGLFLKAGEGNYVGGATISVAGVFQLGAIGGYGQIPPKAGNKGKGEGSMFIFASLAAPLGGPPFFFITGIAGGFGYNRRLPAVEDLHALADHVFFQVMQGVIPFNPKIDPAKPGDSLNTLAASFDIALGRYWIAAGIQFTCFGFINGKVVATVEFGKNLSFHLLGMLTFAIKPVAYFELVFDMHADADSFLLRAGITPNSYLIDPAIAKLCGDFALGAWYSGEAAGDFLVSVGGYHPYFTPLPKYYPGLSRVSCKAMLEGVHLSVECFFACTPQALMAGAAVSLYGEFAGISAGLDVSVDVLMTWDPFYLQAEMDVTVWFHFCGRHEVGVGLQIHTPKFGGTATIDLSLVSFDIDFGADEHFPPPPALPDFFTRQLAVPAADSGKGVSLRAFNQGTTAGLFHVDFTAGRVAGPPQDDHTQEGTGQPVQVNAEFAFTVKTKLPIREQFQTDGDVDKPPLAGLQGQVDLPLCRQMDLPSTLTVSAAPGQTVKGRPTRLVDLFPAANFGEVLAGAQAGNDTDTAQSLVAEVAKKSPSVSLSDGIAFDFGATLSPLDQGSGDENGYLAGSADGTSDGTEDLPLPLGGTKPHKNRQTRAALSFGKGAVQGKLPAHVRGASSRQVAAERYAKTRSAPLNVSVQHFRFSRATVDTRTVTLASPAANVVAIDVPASPARRPELSAVRLALTPARLFGAAPSGGARERSGEIHLDLPPVVTPGPVLPTGPARPVPVPVPRPAPAPAGGAQTVSLVAHQAACFVLTGGTADASHTLTCAGQGNARAVYLGGAEEYLDDAYLSQGSIQKTPPRARKIFLLYEGTEIPVAAGLPIGTQTLRENVGVERDSTLQCLGDRTFAAHGCVLQSSMALGFRSHLLEAVPGAQVLAALTRFQMYFPRMQKGVSLVLVLEPNADDPAPALGQVRWAASGAALGGLQTVVAPERTALVMNVEPAGDWSLDLDLGRDWRFAAVVAAAAPGRELAVRLQQGGDWDFIDDRIATGAAGTDIKVTLTPQP